MPISKLWRESHTNLAYTLAHEGVTFWMIHHISLKQRFRLSERAKKVNCGNRREDSHPVSLHATRDLRGKEFGKVIQVQLIAMPVHRIRKVETEVFLIMEA